MKGFKQVEATRQQYHKDPNANSVHRSSLMVPEIPNASAEISFLNHFLIKRNYQKVACKITPIDTTGKKLESRLYPIDKPKVYTFKLSGMEEVQVSNYLVEFFAAENLFIPYPAVMVNHHGNGFINQVHSFNRVLNDVFEDDSINSAQVNEASIDLILEDKIDTFLLFSTGPLPCKGPLEIEILTNNKKIVKTIQIDLPRFATKKISLRDTFSDIPNGIKGVLKVKQPRQFLFYGRMLAGQFTPDGAFSGNHTYYDSSSVSEYWDNGQLSQRFYPFFTELTNVIRMYPIMSPSKISLSVGLYRDDGSLISEKDVGSLTSPGSDFLDITINSIAKSKGVELKDISTFSLNALAEDGKLPTRINHQLVHGSGGLSSSVNVSLFNSNIFVPQGKKGFSWGQTIIGRDYDSFVAIVADACSNPKVKNHDVTVNFYDEEGKLAERNWIVPNGSAIKFMVAKELAPELSRSTKDKVENIWCTVDSEQYGVTLFIVTRNNVTMHCSGEHAF